MLGPFSVLGGRSGDDASDDEHGGRRADHGLAVRGLAQRGPEVPGRCQFQGMFDRHVAIDSGFQTVHVANDHVDLQRIERPGGRRGAEAASPLPLKAFGGLFDRVRHALRRPQNLPQLVQSQRPRIVTADRAPLGQRLFH